MRQTPPCHAWRRLRWQLVRAGWGVLLVGWAAGVPAAGRVPVLPPAAEARFVGPLLLITGTAEVESTNDEAVATFYLEVQDADPARVQSQLNQKVAEGVAALKRADPKGEVESSGYSSTPIYAQGARRIVGWRARQAVTLRTGELTTLSRTVAGAQQAMALGGIDFRLSRAAREKTEAELIQRAILNLNARVAAVAQALGVPPARVRIEELNFGAVGGGGPVPIAMMARAQAQEAVAEPVLEAGKSTQQMTVTARVRLLAP
jgi:predicted secreted protein